MYEVKYTNLFKKGVKRAQRRGLDLGLLREAVRLLRTTGKLPPAYKPHKLTGNRAGQWECHLQPDWLMVWRQDDRQLILIFIDTGTHADLF